jgi:ATP-dependent Clp protease ATP-binding subunit ClpA
MQAMASQATDAQTAHAELAARPSQPLTEKTFLEDIQTTPRWIKDVFRFLAVKSQFILSGNVRDRYPFPGTAGQYVDMPLTQYLAETLRLRGFERFISYDLTDGFYVVVPRGEQATDARSFFKDKFKLVFDEGGQAKATLERSLEIIADIIKWRDEFIGVFADFASRYAVRLDSLSPREHEYFAKALKLSHTATPHVTAAIKEAQFNTLFWICDKENDLPGWFSVNNPRMRSVVIPKPDHIARRTLIDTFASSLPGFEECTPAEREQHRDAFVEQTEGMVLTDAIAITQLCRRQQLKFGDIREAIRQYKLGVTEDPWRKLDKKKIAKGAETIGSRVKGQEQAVQKALDIIKRAVTGLSGAQASKVGGRPRGVLFLAGPTGVGKTELAKALTQLLFNDERAYIRFDMSEFSAEHADQRLLGAPPSYVGYEAGGELTNAIREKPFAVVLFDEIEKAHPRLLDKFLQLLDDGVLTSGRGERVYFSESVIIFTSNLGIYRIGPEGNRVANVNAEQDDYEAVERKVRFEIEAYFKNQLNRPELLNRIGENIVVFDFIRAAVANQIFDKMVRDILARLVEQRQIAVSMSDKVRDALRERCTRDLSNGGRGIGNVLEAWLINPLARALFDQDVPDSTRVSISSLDDGNGVPTLTLTTAAEGLNK